MILKAAETCSLRRSTPDVEEVGGLTTTMFDDVHGRHGKAGTIHQTGDVAIETNVVQIKLRGFHLAGSSSSVSR